MKDQSATPKSGAGRRSKYRHGAPAGNVQAITNAAVSHSEEMHSRMVKYAVTMGIRMVCLAAIFVFDGWFKLIPVIGAVVLPWVAVVIANGGADIVHQETVELLDEAPMYAVAGGEPGPGGSAEADDVLPGEIVPDETAQDQTAPDQTAGDEPAGPAGDAPDDGDSAGTTAAASHSATHDARENDARAAGTGASNAAAASQEPSQEDKHHEHL
ncbi:DUF3099 domain-containing protein [Specibacter sp. AOP5-B1-6]|uniref:DUF3099 domain-containing protein n=1 Tax=Specibacter sp. AOP5-B1-6 TaxID=3457653 RepID=UPI00402BC829